MEGQRSPGRTEWRSPAAGVAEYQRLIDAYPALGYEVTILPKIGVGQRAEFVLRTLAGQL